MERLIGVVVVGLVYCFFIFPIPAITISVIGVIAYLIFINIRRQGHPPEEIQARLTVLKEVEMYLSPYTSIWKNLKLSNKHCSLSLGEDGVTIKAVEKGGECRSFTVVSSSVYSMPVLWNLFCHHFDSTKTYYGLKDECRIYRVQIREYIRPKSQNAFYLSGPKQNVVDINNASEIEITALPGISIVLAKKLIKKREEIGGFKNTHEVFVYLKLKPHMENQLRDLICVNKMQGSVKIEKYQERHVDL